MFLLKIVAFVALYENVSAYDSTRSGLSCIRTYLANFYTSATRDFSGLRCRGDLSSYDVGETPDDELDFKRHCPISICLEARSIGVWIFENFRDFRKFSIFRFSGKFQLKSNLFRFSIFPKILDFPIFENFQLKSNFFRFSDFSIFPTSAIFSIKMFANFVMIF